MVRIGVFARLAEVSIKTLRYYDEVSLLKPSYIDDWSGYRYYTLDQLPRLYRILAGSAELASASIFVYNFLCPIPFPILLNPCLLRC
jgi:hypothetical protein